jgi:hypothetical protein
MHEELIKIIAIVIFIGILIYVVLKSIKYKSNLMEGFDTTSIIGTTGTGTTDTTVGASKTTNFTSTNLGNIDTYSGNLDSRYNTLKAGMKINSTNVNSFHNAIIAMDDNVSIMMINTLLNMDPNNITDASIANVLTKLNLLDAGKKSLNTLLKSVDFVAK